VTRVIAYVDGMNLYHGLRTKHGRKYHWLNIESLAVSLLRPGQRLVQVLYFTARVRNQPTSEQRQDDYLGALTACCPKLEIIEGRFQERSTTCSSCQTRRTTYDEKETDVNLAAALIRDAVLDRFDTALLVSADGDLCPAIRVVRELAPTKRTVAVFPPQRRSDALRRAADATFTIGTAKIRQAQLPGKVLLQTGVIVERPNYWQ
jgi:uncharacterized LabA/DUF88 family protein